MTSSIQISSLAFPAEKSAACERIITRLPDWFGMPESNRVYIQDIADKDVFAAIINDMVIGLIALKYHFNKTAEIWWLGVDPDFHGQGTGNALVEQAKNHACQKGCTAMILNTVSSRSDDPYYARTRKFYEGCGFEPLFEFNETDPVNPMMWMILPLHPM